MAQIANLNVQVNQNPTSQNQISLGGAEPVAGRAHPSAGFRTGTLVEGQVLSQDADGNYTVRLSAQGGQGTQNLLARATVALIVGEHFHAVWDASGSIPVLRLSESELSFLSQLPQGDRELGMALLSRGMPLSNAVLLSIREAWRRMGGRSDQLSPLLELWARNLPMTPENVGILQGYLALENGSANALWARIRKRLKERTLKGENPVDILRELKEGADEVGQFLKGHSLLLRVPREEVNPVLLEAPLWPALDDSAQLLARVFVGRVRKEGERRYWQMGFELDGSRLGAISGDVESDGRSFNVNLCAEEPATCELLKRRRHAIRKELEGLPLALQFIGISRALTGALRQQLLVARGLDLRV